MQVTKREATDADVCYYRNAESVRLGEGTMRKPLLPRRKLLFPRLEFWEKTAVAAMALEGVGLALYAGALRSWAALAILFLLALAAAGGGGVLGFLFGVPRLKTDAKTDGDYVHNTNLEQVSDWLTKIIIGATLVQIDDIARAIGGLSSSIGDKIDESGGAVAVTSILVFSFVGGFMWSYLWTSLRLKKELDHKFRHPGDGQGKSSSGGDRSAADLAPT